MSNLFTAVSVEQQEIVAGGYDLAQFNTSFSGINSVQQGGSNSGFNGSTAVGTQGSISVDSFALTTLATNAPAGLVPAVVVVAPRL
ncbi:MAG: CTB family bacteriocin [Nostocales cyanobacterium LE14-WE4]|uniref:CTB family bacteriocin n=1 Tax=Anabaena sp. AL09 TaxID=1710891 RepID=UPI0008003600|nr:CTB family bacteriocin [Anabaena sp. AL09]MCE2696513.1 CTB family bacteriocin [Anabaena sp. 49633_E8]MCE2702284.1 CTB family bacteriocin [Anabaena sp. 49633_E8]MDJ0503078.1 CTB family bacteriocin [Nostocales cyanobacterium LE14-WE4]OBQ06685.1 MAG: hypothetical protein AN490_12090 [Anabaena sp. AL09]